MNIHALLQTHTVYATIENNRVIFDCEDDLKRQKQHELDESILPIHSFRPGTQVTFKLANKGAEFSFLQPVMVEPKGFHDLSCIISNDKQSITFINYGREIQPIKVYLTVAHQGEKLKSKHPLISCKPSFVERFVASISRSKRKGHLNVAD